MTVAQLGAVCHERLLVVTADTGLAENLIAALQTYWTILGDDRPLIPVPEVSAGHRNQWLPENEAARCAALDRALNPGSAVFITSVFGLLTAAPPPAQYAERTFVLRVGQSGIAPDTVAARLVELDYDNEFEVHVPGEFSRRGGILDVYSPLHDNPVRIEFFGDTIESMRFFLPETQRSSGGTDHVRIVPRGEAVLAAEGGCAADYFGPELPVAVCDPAAIVAHLERFGTSAMREQWERFLSQRHRTCLVGSTPPAQPTGVDSAPQVVRPDPVALGSDLSPTVSGADAGPGLWHWRRLREHLQLWKDSGCQVVACCGSEGDATRFRELLAEDAQTAATPVAIEPLRLDIGVLIPAAHLVLLSERELFGRRPDARRRTRSPYHIDAALREGADLEEGRFAVHAAHGVCIFHGVREIEVNGELHDVLDLEFDEEARLYVPLDQVHLVSRYVGGNRKMPRLSRLGGAGWKKAKAAATSATLDLAAELLRIDATRRETGGVEFRSVREWEEPFTQAFPYTETEDQKRAICEVLADMERLEPMDRLLCGDVGYGKTEVAMRAAFRAVMNGRQVAVLVPTTVLAQQHHVTFRERMAEYPVEIDVLSRFRSHGDQNRVLERLALGQIDIVIGTHRLIQKDVVFANLGLVIIDEEQRFGVQHKQRFKELRTKVDVLTMTATPIPRTLYLSLSGIRNLSTILTAPAERLPITTVLAAYDPELIRQVILLELERQGQVYFVHNRVQTIEKMCANLRRLLPEARFAVAHGQMASDTLEEVMTRFMDGAVDVLVCTTIIESGLDIPNANTILIDRADRFGLAELYQLRGRVGRYHRQAHAYLLIPPMGSLPQDARQRLAAIRRYTHLGAGFKLALRDLEIRGAGNILGAEQSGHIAAVGFELYCTLLKEAVARLARTPAAAGPVPVVVQMDTLVFGSRGRPGTSPAEIGTPYVGAEAVRLGCYRRLSEVGSVADVDALEAELMDRFGPLPRPTENLLQVARIRALARRVGVTSLTVSQQNVILLWSAGQTKPEPIRRLRLHSRDAEGQLEELIGVLDALMEK
ncbi:MAG: transcription-repair coupling factor [Lentisphaerae bacterium RIFOXYB12_FULL_65_16]|nr:MAG: transcription-repair coupling factor [Lentisphaerae bacterium RIFOXYA12_64_32]OGV87379.1 MAG: transcription-repair coupling factor [Lentisphaerae bacterium RIFOXYB12_FULL_65_16]